MPDHDDVARFRDAATAYLACIDAAGDRGADRTIRDAAGILAGLYSAAVSLPLVEPEIDDASDGTERGEAREALYRRLGDAGIGAYYWQLNPFLGDTPGDEVVGDLAEDLADIYLDLRRGFGIIDAGGSVNDAVWEWRFAFESHWGQHAVDALRVIHTLANDKRDASTDE